MLNAFRQGVNDSCPCPQCGSSTGKKLDAPRASRLAFEFFVRGTLHRTKFGGAPVLQFNAHQKTSVTFEEKLQEDAKLIADAIGIGFFHYGPRLWMVGEVEPLKSLESPEERKGVLARILTEYPTRRLNPGDLFYRLRINPCRPAQEAEYDSPPDELIGRGRLDSSDVPVLYASQDLEVCIHECRATVDDLIFVATLTPNRELRVLDLTELLEEDATEFESLDMAVHMLFLAGEHSYEISRALAREAQEKGLDGIVFPSYFSMIRTGAIPFETVYGLSVRRLPPFRERVLAQTIRNLAFFGRPISAEAIKIECVNRVVINHAAYGLSYGPVEY
jgi:hypothetical protein